MPRQGKGDTETNDQQPTLMTQGQCPTCAKAFTLGPDDTLVVPCVSVAESDAIAASFRNTQPNFQVAIVCHDAIQDMRYADLVKLTELIRGSISVPAAADLLRQRTLVIQKPGAWG